MYWYEITELQYTAGSQLLTIIDLENLNTQHSNYVQHVLNMHCNLAFYDINLLFLLKHYFHTVKIH